MIQKSYPRSIIKRMPEKDLASLNDSFEVLQVEHIPEAIRENYHCLVEYIPKTEYKTETMYSKMEDMYNRTAKEFKEAAELIIGSLQRTDDGEPLPIIENDEKFEKAIDLLFDFFNMKEGTV